MALTPVMSSTDLELPAELLDVKPLSGANRRASSPASLKGVRGVDELHTWVVRALYSAPAPGDGPAKEPGRAELEEWVDGVLDEVEVFLAQREFEPAVSRYKLLSLAQYLTAAAAAAAGGPAGPQEVADGAAVDPAEISPELGGGRRPHPVSLTQGLKAQRVRGRLLAHYQSKFLEALRESVAEGKTSDGLREQVYWMLTVANDDASALATLSACVREHRLEAGRGGGDPADALAALAALAGIVLEALLMTYKAPPRATVVALYAHPVAKLLHRALAAVEPVDAAALAALGAAFGHLDAYRRRVLDHLVEAFDVDLEAGQRLVREMGRHFVDEADRVGFRAGAAALFRSLAGPLGGAPARGGEGARKGPADGPGTATAVLRAVERCWGHARQVVAQDDDLVPVDALLHPLRAVLASLATAPSGYPAAGALFELRAAAAAFCEVLAGRGGGGRDGGRGGGRDGGGGAAPPTLP